MDVKKIRSQPSEAERQMPHFEDLTPLYSDLGGMATRVALNFEPAQDALAEKILAYDEAYEPGHEVYEAITAALSADKEERDAKALDAGIAAAVHIIENSKNTRGLITGYLKACFEFDRIKVGTQGMKADMSAEHLVAYFTREMLLDEIPAEQRTLKIAFNVADSIHQLSHTEKFFGWFMPKIAMLQQDLHTVVGAKEVAGRMPITPKESIENSGGSETYANNVKEFVNRTMAERKYGVKPAYIEASIGGSWIYYDKDDYMDLVPINFEPRYAAVVFHTHKDELTSLKIKKEVQRYSNNGQVTVLTGALEDAQPDARFTIGYDGEIYLDDSLLNPVRRVLKDTPGAYESLQAEIIANLHDLSVSAGTIDVERMPNFTQLSDTEKKNYDPVLQLLVPRMKRVYHGEESDEVSRTTVREHDVVWFTRKLPEGWRASPEAIALAEKHNITLEPNETFVRKHKRGKGNPVQGHKIVSVSSSAA